MSTSGGFRFGRREDLRSFSLEVLLPKQISLAKTVDSVLLASAITVLVLMGFHKSTSVYQKWFLKDLLKVVRLKNFSSSVIDEGFLKTIASLIKLIV